jgi:pyrroline-5-carboxylate reductase
MSALKVGFIGSGKMATAIASGIIRERNIKSSNYIFL